MVCVANHQHLGIICSSTISSKSGLLQCELLYFPVSLLHHVDYVDYLHILIHNHLSIFTWLPYVPQRALSMDLQNSKGSRHLLSKVLGLKRDLIVIWPNSLQFPVFYLISLTDFYLNNSSDEKFTPSQRSSHHLREYYVLENSSSHLVELSLTLTSYSQQF